MKMRLLPLVAISALIAACTGLSSEESTVKESLEKTLKDPGSVQYRDFKVYRTRPTVACGAYNAKNGYGAYTGFKDFIYDDGVIHVAGDGTTMPSWICQEPAK
jgi:hypothetical protein